MNHNLSAADQPEFEEWHLTALALGELSPELADATLRRIESDPELAKQLKEIQSTLAWIERDLKQTADVTGLDDEHRETVLAQIRSTSNDPSHPSLVSPSTIQRKSSWTTWRAAGALGVLALAASVLVMFQMSGSPDLQSGTLGYLPQSMPGEAGPKSAAPARHGGEPAPSAPSAQPAPSAKRLGQEMDPTNDLKFDANAANGVVATDPRSLHNEEILLRESVAQEAKKQALATSSPASAGASPPADTAEKDAVLLLPMEKSAANSTPSNEVDRFAHEPLSDAPASQEFGAARGLGSTAPTPVPPGARPAMPGAGGYDADGIGGGGVGGSSGVSGLAPAVVAGEVAGRDGVALSGGLSLEEEATTERGTKLELRGRALHDSEPTGIPEPQEQYSIIPEELRANVPSLKRLSEGKVGDRFDAISETPFAEVSRHPLSTFSIDVDTASYSKLRQYVLEQHMLPSADSIRIEEWINYFDYAYPGPADEAPFAAHLRMAPCPWNPEHKLVRIAIQARKEQTENRPNSNLVFLIDVSGSMSDNNKLPLVKRTLNLLTQQLREQDRVAIVVYAGAAGCVLPSTSGANKEAILASINELQSGGSTNGGQGIELAYRIAKENFIPGGVNRVLLCTDGDFNVGVTGTDQLVAMMKENAQSNVFLSVLGYGIGNYNDAMMEQVSNQGNGTYAMIDSELEAKRVMVEQLSGTLSTVAKDVKIQVEFNPQRVGSYRLIGYENRRLAAKDFNDDRKDAGEIGAGHRVTALYEIVPAGVSDSSADVDSLRYAKRRSAEKPKPEAGEVPEAIANEWLYLKIRSKKPEASESTLQDFVLRDEAPESYTADRSDMDWAASIAEFGLLMRRSQLAPGADWERMISRAIENAGSDPYRRECILIMQQARRLMGK